MIPETLLPKESATGIKGSSSPHPSDGESIALSEAYAAELKANEKAWQFFNTLAPSARKMSIGWVMRAKKEETRLRKLGIWIDSSEGGQKIPPLIISKKRRD